jgi:hypothetical protein
MNWGRSTRPDPTRCGHHDTITVVHSGLERVVCEACGLVSVRYESELTGERDRLSFARPADERESQLTPPTVWERQLVAAAR